MFISKANQHLTIKPYSGPKVKHIMAPVVEKLSEEIKTILYRFDRVYISVMLTGGIPNYNYYRSNPDISLNIGVSCSTPANEYQVHPGDNRGFRPFPTSARPSMKSKKMSEN